MGSHGVAVALANNALASKEPVPSSVLAWGWVLKQVRPRGTCRAHMHAAHFASRCELTRRLRLLQGEGGYLHADTFKTRWFVLARVPHATVLIYYDRKCMDEDHILGYIDMRRVIAIRESSKGVAFDGSRNAVAGFMHKLRGLVGKASLDRTTRPVLELVTSNRVFTLCPAAVDLPGPMTMAAATGPSVYGKPLYLFGWPFPVPPLEGAVMSSGDEQDDPDDAAVAASDAESMEAAQALLDKADGDEVRCVRRARRVVRPCPHPPSLNPIRSFLSSQCGATGCGRSWRWRRRRASSRSCSWWTQPPPCPSACCCA
jgi:hypothetical protein